MIWVWLLSMKNTNLLCQVWSCTTLSSADAAIVLAQQHHAKLLLGSATPSIESRYNVTREKYVHVNLSERFGDAQLPCIETVDLKEAHKRKAMKGLFSPRLYTAMDDCLNDGKQIILFQNRRGYAPLLECHSCGHIPQCTNCDVSLTIINTISNCDAIIVVITLRSPFTSGLPARAEVKGTGTQQIEEQVQQYFPAAPVERMDWDSTVENALLKGLLNGLVQVKCAYW